jgi:hypothetical protein
MGFAVLVLYVIQDLHPRPGVYGLMLAISAVGGIGPPITRRLGPWRWLLIAEMDGPSWARSQVTGQR